MACLSRALSIFPHMFKVTSVTLALDRELDWHTRRFPHLQHSQAEDSGVGWADDGPAWRIDGGGSVMYNAYAWLTCYFWHS